MTGATLAAALGERGLDASEVAAKRGLFDLVLSGLAKLPGGHGHEHVWWVPGRLEVFGKHTDYAGGRTLVCAVPRGLALAAAPRRDGWIHVVDARRNESMTLEPPGRSGDGASQSTAGGALRTAPAEFSGWRHYVEVVAGRLARNFPGAATGANVVIASDLPRASGMSSSSTLVVGLAAALARVAQLESRAEWQANVRTPLDAAGYFACIENGLTFGTLAGDAGVGTHGGSEDHAAILTGVPARLSAFAFVPMRPIATVDVPGAWRFVLSPCGVKAAKTGAAQGSYNRLSEGTQLLLDLWNSTGPQAGSLGAALGMDRTDVSGAASLDTGALDRLRQLVRHADITGWRVESLEKRLDHFVREDARVPLALDAFREADRERLGKLSGESQADADNLLGNQVPETTALARSARELGAFAACSFGAGFGGSVWALVEREQAREFAARWHREAFVAVPGPPLTAL